MRSPRLMLVAALAVVLVTAGGALGSALLIPGDSAPPVSDGAVDLFAKASKRRTTTDTQIETLQSRLSKGKPDAFQLASLGLAYIQKARETGDPSYYGKAEAVFNQSLELAPENAEALGGMGVLSLALHQFAQALEWGQRAVAANPYRASGYGIVTDALVDLGRYDEAVVAAQKMVDTRPDLSSYARVSYLRELYGDVAGAVDAMRRSVNAGGPVAENSSYVNVQLGNLFFNSGRIDEAEKEYEYTLQRNPGYGVGQAALALVRAARGDDPAAIDLLKQAIEALPLPEYVIMLGDLYGRNGRMQEAREAYDLVRVITRLQTAFGMDMNVETALFDADHGIDLPTALERARQGYAKRPNIHAADVLAWTLYKMGRPEEAEAYSRESLRLGTKDALKLYHAAMIARALGKTDQARAFLEQALGINPNFSLLYADSARETLVSLGGTVPLPAATRSWP